MARNNLSLAMTRIGEAFVNTQGHQAVITGLSSAKHKGARFIITFTDSGYISEAAMGNLQKGHFRDYSQPSVYGVGISYPGASRINRKIYKTWVHMLERCYSVNCAEYWRYGGRGVKVCDRWLVYRNFEQDAKLLRGYAECMANPTRDYSLDKDIIGDGTLYSPETCVFATQREQVHAIERVKPIIAHRHGEYFIFPSKHEAAQTLGIPNANLYRALRSNGRLHAGGYRFVLAA